MTRRIDHPTIEHKVVVVFDICSSSQIIEDLNSSGNLHAWRNLLIRIKKFLRSKSQDGLLEVYKFTGDGWILFFSADASGTTVIRLLTELSKRFRREIRKRVLPLLDSIPTLTGITFGVDRGPLIRIVMMGQAEYIGRSLNIACRLQTAIKDRDKKPAYKVLMSRHLFQSWSQELARFEPQEVKRDLRNIRKGFRCVKVRLHL